jgi:hypothetical protein
MLLFEPSLASGQMVVDRKGTGNFTAVIRGRAAHAGRDLALGRNAIVHAARLALEVDSWNRISTHEDDQHAVAPTLSVNVGCISGGGVLNQVRWAFRKAISFGVCRPATAMIYKPRVFISSVKRESLAVMKRVRWSFPPKQTFAVQPLGTAITPNRFPSAAKTVTPSLPVK